MFVKFKSQISKPLFYIYLDTIHLQNKLLLMIIGEIKFLRSLYQ